MWIVGLIIGAIIGASAGGGLGMLAGAAIGAVIGQTLSKKSGAAENLSLRTLQDAIHRLEDRVKALEQGAPRDTTVAAQDVAAAPVQPEPQAPVTDAPPPAAEPAMQGAGEEHVPATAETVTATTRAPFAVSAARDAESWWQRMIGGNIVAKVGVVVLFFGVGFLLKYAYDNALLPVPVRLAGVAAFAAVMFVGGSRMLATRRLYALILQGGGVGLMYLDVFFALRIYSLIAPAWGFLLFVLLGAAATLLAVRQDSRVLAMLGLSGAFLAPVLAGSETGSHVMLFSYYLLLNGLILAVSWFKAWRGLNLVGFVFTFIIGYLWGTANYQPQHFATVEPFVLAFFAMYLVIPILFAQRQPPRLRGIVDGTLVFGTPLVAAFMQAGLVHDMPYGLAWSAGCAAVLYAVLAVMVRRGEAMRVLAEAYVALAVVFATLTIFFALDAYPTFALWTLEGAAIVWIGLRQQRLLARLFGLALQAAGALYFLSLYFTYDLSNPWFNDFVLGCLIIAAAALTTSGLMHRYRDVLIRGGEAVGLLLLLWGVLWWFIGGLHAVGHGMQDADVPAAMLIFVAVSAGIFELAGAWARWTHLRRIQIMLIVFMPFVALGQAAELDHPFANYGWLAWPLAAAILYATLLRQERDAVAVVPGVQHVAMLWLLTLLAAWESSWQLGSHGFAAGWRLAAWGAVPALVLGLVSRYASVIAWPLSAHEATYRGIGLAPVALFCALWSIYALADPGRAAPLPYLPVLNPLELAQLLALFAMKAWLDARVGGVEAPGRQGHAALAAFAFLALNSVVLRAVHHWAGVRYTLDAMLDSVLAQAALSLLWTATALLLMLYARRSGWHAAWMGGAALLALVVGKLFLFDLANSGTVERIVTFLGVGVGLLVIGYVAPVPPGEKERPTG